MKKSLIAVAALAATGAFAQSSVTVYGNIDVAWATQKSQNLNDTVNTKSNGLMDGNYAGSRIGFRGVEDLGGGLSAEFVLEQGMSPTSADGWNKRTGSNGNQVDGVGTYTTSTNRQSYVGLKSGMGTLRAGYQYTNSYDLVAFNGLSMSEFTGGSFQLGSVTGALSVHANSTRANAVTYISPTFNGITVKAQYGQGTGRQTMESNIAATATAAGGSNGYKVNNNTFSSLMAQYANGPVFAALAYSKADLKTEAGAAPSTGLSSPYTGTAVTTQNAYGGVSAVTAPTNTAQRPQTGLNYGASYNFGFATVTYVGGKVEGAPTSSASESKVKSNQYSVKVPVGAMELIASTGNATKTTTGTTNNDVKGTFIGVNYNLSKRTVAYAYTGSEKDNAVTTVGTSTNFKDSKTALGLRHAF